MRAGCWKTLNDAQITETTPLWAGSIWASNLPVLLLGYLEEGSLLSRCKGQEGLDLPRTCFFLTSVQDPCKPSPQGLSQARKR